VVPSRVWRRTSQEAIHNIVRNCMTKVKLFTRNGRYWNRLSLSFSSTDMSSFNAR
jgi:hypothetical protein